MLKKILCLFLIACCLPMPANGQDPPECVVTGRAWKANRQPAANVVLRIVRIKLPGKTISTEQVLIGPSDENGYFTFTTFQGAQIWIYGPAQEYNVAGGKRFDIPNEPTANLDDLDTTTLFPPTGLVLKDEGIQLQGLYGTINVTGANVQVSKQSPGVATLTISGGGGSSVWGGITGTLSNQTDLQAALGAKATDNAVVHLLGAETITGAKTFSSGASFTLADPTTATKRAQFDLSNVSANNTRQINIPDANSTTVQPSAAVANQFVTGISAQGVITRAQPSFTDLSGAASDAQIPNTITLDNLTQVATRNYSDLQNIPASFAPSAHASSHQHGGTDEVGTATPGANAIPKAGAGGTLADAWLSANVSLLGSSIDLSGAEATGTLAAARFPVLTGDVTNSAGSLATTIAARAVTAAKFFSVTDNRLLGRSAGTDGDVQQIQIGSGLQLSGGILSATGGSGANAALSNLASVAINASLLPGTDNSISLGSGSFRWLDLFLSGAIKDANSNELLKFVSVANAVNEVTISPAATGAYPEISATGSDTNIALRLTSKGNLGVLFPDGNVGGNQYPGIGFINDSDTGFYRNNGGGAGVTVTVNGHQALWINDGALWHVGAFGSVSYFYSAGGRFSIPSSSAFSFASGSEAHNTLIAGLNSPAAKVIGLTDGSTGGGTFASVATTPAQITADQNNYNPGGTSYLQRWSSDASRTVTGLTFAVAQVAGQTHCICNINSNNIVLAHDDGASSTAANRFKFTGGSNVTIAADACVIVTYDGTSQRWRRAQ